MVSLFRIFLQTVSESVFSQQHTLKAVVIKALGWTGKEAAAKLEVDKQNQSKFNVQIDGNVLSVIRV